MRQKGFAPIVIFVLVAIGIAAYFGYKYYKSSTQPVAVSLSSSTDRMWGVSMLPTLKEGNPLNIDMNFDRNNLKRGDLVVYKEDTASNKIFGPKRIIALGGDTLKLVNGIVYLNGTKLEEDYLLEQASTSPEKYLPEGIDTKIPAGTVFLMGDNRQHSADSRLSGPLQLEKIAGIVTF